MWVMFLVMGIHGEFSAGQTSAVPVTVITQEFANQSTCNDAVKVAKKSKKTYDAWCVKK